MKKRIKLLKNTWNLKVKSRDHQLLLLWCITKWDIRVQANFMQKSELLGTASILGKVKY